MTDLWLLSVLAALLTYLVGGLPFGVVVGRLKGVDVREAGSGNIGAANVGRLLGRRWGVAVFLLDMLKGLIPTAVVGHLLQSARAGSPVADSTVSLLWLFVGFCAILGHNYSPFIGFRGGKGVATSMGVALGVHPHLTAPALAAFAVWVIGIRLTGMSSLGSICGGIVFPLAYVVGVWARGGNVLDHWPFLGFSLLVSVLLLLRHRANIVRILQGTEARFGRSGPADSAGTE